MAGASDAGATMSDALKRAASRWEEWIKEMSATVERMPAPDQGPRQFWLGTDVSLAQGNKLFLRAVVACPQCGGTSTYRNEWGHDPQPCPAEHVELDIAGQTVHANPDKCLFWCARYRKQVDPKRPGPCRVANNESATHGHQSCSWQIRPDVIMEALT